MSKTISDKKFLQEEVMSILNQLKKDTPATFGLMSPQHMVEHLIYTTKATTGRKGEAPDEPYKSHLSFKKFIAKGAIFQYRPKEGITKENLPALKYDSLEEAINEIPVAVDRFFKYFKVEPNVLCYNPMMGELNYEELLLFHANHYRWHFKQFSLMEGDDELMK